MGRPRARTALIGIVGALAFFTCFAGAARPLQMGFTVVIVDAGAAARLVDAGANGVVIQLRWSALVSAQAGTAVDFDPSDPASPYYTWTSLDQQVAAAHASGIEASAQIVGPPPAWALASASAGLPPSLPDPTALAQFAAAAAARYSGGFQGLPRIRAWALWNEPNLTTNLDPQFLDGAPFAPGWYRTMVNAVHDSVKAIQPDALIVAGDTAPFIDITPEVTAVDPAWGPLSFMRELFCLSDTLQPTCSTPVKLDVWSTHPYSEGGPERRATVPDDVSIPDLPKMRAVLDAAEAHGHIVSSGPVELWATEFSWDSNPPDPLAVPAAVLQRWLPQALYSMWQDGVTRVAWFTLMDHVPPDPYQSGILFADGTPKPYAQALRFPLVGINYRDQLEVWGRTPGGIPATVTIQQGGGATWTTLGDLASDADGIFQGRFDAAPTGSIRATHKTTGEHSATYPLGADPHVNDFYTAFGFGFPLEPPAESRRPALPALTGGYPPRIGVQQQLQSGG